MKQSSTVWASDDYFVEVRECYKNIDRMTKGNFVLLELWSMNINVFTTVLLGEQGNQERFG